MVGSTTQYLPALLNGKVLYVSAKLVEPYDPGKAVLDTAKAMADYMVAKGYHYRASGGNHGRHLRRLQNQGLKGCTCTRFVSWVLQASGHLKSGKLLGHNMSGKEYLVNCQILKLGKSAKSLLDIKALMPGDVLVSAKATAGANACCIFAGYDGPTWYEAGGPFHGTNCAKASNLYINIGPLKVSYDATHPKVEYIIRPM